uniref:Uncharacterized protein n=1 Tax=Moniliophthora roreri TaxID=221103 RepID=A0A0W0F1Y2_MONRR
MSSSKVFVASRHELNTGFPAFLANLRSRLPLARIRRQYITKRLLETSYSFITSALKASHKATRFLEDAVDNGTWLDPLECRYGFVPDPETMEFYQPTVPIDCVSVENTKVFSTVEDYARRNRSLESPSTLAQPTQYRQAQGDNLQFEYEDTTAIPIELYSPIFARFNFRLEDPHFVPPKSVEKIAGRLLLAASAVYPDKDSPLETLRPLYESLLGAVFHSEEEAGCKPDGVSRTIIRIED